MSDAASATPFKAAVQIPAEYSIPDVTVADDFAERLVGTEGLSTVGSTFFNTASQRVTGHLLFVLQDSGALSPRGAAEFAAVPRTC